MTDEELLELALEMLEVLVEYLELEKEKENGLK